MPRKRVQKGGTNIPLTGLVRLIRGGSHFSNITGRTLKQRVFEHAVGHVKRLHDHHKKARTVSTYLKGHSNPWAKAAGHAVSYLGYGRKRMIHH